MPERSRKKRPRDINALAAAIVSEATDEDRQPEDPYEGKDPAAVELGRRGGLKGGRARAEKLTPEQRSEIAKKAAAARWQRERTERERQLAPLQRRAELLRQMAEIAEEWDRLGGDLPTATTAISDIGQHAQQDVPVKMSQRAKVILKENPGQYINVRAIWQGAVDRGWIEPTKETRAAMRVALHRLAARDDSIECVEQPPTHAYRWLPSTTPEPSHNGAGRGLWETGAPMQ